MPESENTPPPTDLMAALLASLDQAKKEREQRQVTLAHITEVHTEDQRAPIAAMKLGETQ